MTILVTGATGFIGRRLIERLVADGERVRAVHRQGAGLQHPLVEWRRVEGLDDAEELDRLVSGIDTIIHLAGLAHQIGKAGEGRAQEFHHINAVITGKLALASVAAGVRRFVFLSSIAVMGTSSDAPLDASMPVNPQTDYGRSKLEGEAALVRALQGTATDWCILRPPVVYGPSNPGNMQRLLRLIDTGIPLPFGAIRNRRSFIFIDNLIDAIITVVKATGRIQDCFIVGDGTDLSTPALVRALAEASKRRVRLLSIPVAMLRALAWCADVVGKVTMRSLPFDSYSVDRLRESLAVNQVPFERRFHWRAPVSTQRALTITCESLQRAKEAA